MNINHDFSPAVSCMNLFCPREPWYLSVPYPLINPFWASQNNTFLTGSRRTINQSFIHHPTRYLGVDTDGEPSTPTIAHRSARWAPPILTYPAAVVWPGTHADWSRVQSAAGDWRRQIDYKARKTQDCSHSHSRFSRSNARSGGAPTRQKSCMILCVSRAQGGRSEESVLREPHPSCSQGQRWHRRQVWVWHQYSTLPLNSPFPRLKNSHSSNRRHMAGASQETEQHDTDLDDICKQQKNKKRKKTQTQAKKNKKT